jgi:hypothetical protein
MQVGTAAKASPVHHIILLYKTKRKDIRMGCHNVYLIQAVTIFYSRIHIS